MSPALPRIEALLTEHGAPYTRTEHAPTYTSDEAAAIRQASVRIGGKSLVIKLGKTFCVFVLSGGRKLHGRMIQRHCKVSRLRFATRAELLELTGLEPGCVPPFGPPIFDLPLYVDSSITANEHIAFNPGDHGVSITMTVADYLRIARPTEIFDFSVPRELP